jgi:hypothetical protein
VMCVRRSLLLIGVFCLSLLALVACSAKASPTPDYPDTPEPSPTSVRSDTPTPSPTSCCPDIPGPTVTIQVEPVSLGVGEALTVVPSLSGYAYPVSVDLYVDAVHVARIGWQDGKVTLYESVAVLRVVSAEEGERQFVLEATAVGEVSVEVSAYGDADFCSCVDGRPSVGTTFKIARSEPVSVTASSPESP